MLRVILLCIIFPPSLSPGARFNFPLSHQSPHHSHPQQILSDWPDLSPSNLSHVITNITNIPIISDFDQAFPPFGFITKLPTDRIQTKQLPYQLFHFPYLSFSPVFPSRRVPKSQWSKKGYWTSTGGRTRRLHLIGKRSSLKRNLPSNRRCHPLLRYATWRL